MSRTDIYTDDEVLQEENQLNYIRVRMRNLPGVMNRILMLIRRKRFNIDDMCATFSNQGFATFTFMIDGDHHDIRHMISQIKKLPDVLEAEDKSGQSEYVSHVVTVHAEPNEDFKTFPVQPSEINRFELHTDAIFYLNSAKFQKLKTFLKEESRSFTRRIFDNS